MLPDSSQQRGYTHHELLRNHKGSHTTKWYNYLFTGLYLVSDPFAFACKPGVIKDGAHIELVRKPILMMDGNGISSRKNLIAGCTVAAIEPGNFVHYRFDSAALST